MNVPQLDFFINNKIKSLTQLLHQESVANIQFQLLEFSHHCFCRGLSSQAIRAADLANSIKKRTVEVWLQETVFNPPFKFLHPTTACEIDLYLRTKNSFERKAYREAISLGLCSTNPVIRFLSLYSSYLRETEAPNTENFSFTRELPKQATRKADLSFLRRELKVLYDKNRLDPFELYLFGLVLKEDKDHKAAVSVFVEALGIYPEFYDCWMELAALLADKLTKVELPNHWMRLFYEAALASERLKYEKSLRCCEILHDFFPVSSLLIAQKALCLYNMRLFEEALLVFAELRFKDPYRLDCIDRLSDIFYVKGDKVQLSYLAHDVARIDKYRPETCCVIGNFYSLRSNHDKAVLYFTRALLFKSSCFFAWTLMGHEYMELKFPSKAINCYLRALEANNKDFRAWYGLGQAFEILDMYDYALFYYRRACLLRPSDGRMWLALASSYELLGMFLEAIQCYEAAAKDEEVSLLSTCRLAQMCSHLKMKDRAAKNFMRVLQDTNVQDDEEMENYKIKACLYLARYFFDRKKYSLSKEFAERIFNWNKREKEEAKAILQDIMTRSVNCVNKGV
ncbi:cell division cycle protein 23 homolog [Zophobas morio]|uniref:cell division cycle protein 23 homolog n=1 Tax=Zophobas morio TaxID=2755281 RepID=UPI0030835E84